MPLSFFRSFEVELTMAKNYREKLAKLQEKMKINFKQPELLEIALTHPSYAFEHSNGKNHNQRLEFLGDAVLGSVVADYLYHHYPYYPEGQLTKIRAAVVCESTLARITERLKLGSYLRLGRGEELSGGGKRPSNLADALEALTAAIFLDQGWEKTRDFLYNLLKEEIEKSAEGFYPDYKTSLQELIQKKGDEKLSYVILSESGPDHAKKFVSGVFWNEQLLGKGTGGSKKEAEQQAAQEVLKTFKKKRVRKEF